MKKTLALLLSMAMLVMLLAACKASESPSTPGTGGDKSETPTTQGTNSEDPSEDPAEDEIDISEHVDLKFLMLGSTLQIDHDKVWAEISKISEEKINASITADVLLTSDMETKYSLMLSSGESYDLIFTGSWAYYKDEAPKGAFHEITLDLVEKYMPMTWANQPHEHFDYVRFGDGKFYMVPASFVNLTGNARVIGIREDLRVEMGVPEVTDLASLETYFDAIIENKPGMFPYAAAANNNELKALLYTTGNELIEIIGEPISKLFSFKYTRGMTAEQAVAAVQYTGDRAEYKEFATLMKSWADKGYWSRSAVAGDTPVKDSYENSTSASFTQNTGTTGASNNTLRRNGYEALMVDLFPNAIRYMGTTVDGLAVPYTSKNLERALMFMDLLKYNQTMYELYRWGIEGEHWDWVDKDARIWKEAANYQNHTHGNGSWGFSSPEYEPRHKDNADPDSVIIFNGWFNDDNIKVQNPLAAFNFDSTNVQNEMSALNNVISQHMYLLDLGHVSDVDAAIAAMNADAKTAGLDKVIAELQSQMDAFLSK